MRILHSASELGLGGHKVCVAIGFFDGVHLGHQQVIRRAVADAQQQEGSAVIVTFDRHPNVIVAPGKVPALIYPLSAKLRVLSSLGADASWVIGFDEPFSRQTGEVFIRRLAADFGQVHSICVGSEFTFGSKRSGNVSLLHALGRELSFEVHGLAAVSLDGQVVSSTRIREAVRVGRLDEAGQMLGRGYSLAGRVIRGNRRGRQLGFPTANLDVTGLALPPLGVYAVHVLLEGKAARAVLNIGFRPTVSGTLSREWPPHVEAHLLDCASDLDLYDQELEVTFVEKLREERQFPSLDQLKKQIAADIDNARRVFDR